MLPNTTDKVQLVTSAAQNVDVSVHYGDYASGSVTLGRQLTAISTATITDILAGPASSTVRKVKALTARNKGSANDDVTVVYDANGTDYELYKTTLKPGEVLQYIEGVGFFKNIEVNDQLTNVSTADQSIGASATVYLTGSEVLFPRTPLVGSFIEWIIHVSKTAAATAAETWTLRFGTNGTTADTTRNTFTLDTETAAADDMTVRIEAIIRGPIGASCIVQAQLQGEDNLTTTGFSNTARKAQVRPSTSSGFDITPANTRVGVVVATGASHALTVRSVIAKAYRL
jgi:hypothetical protein